MIDTISCVSIEILYVNEQKYISLRDRNQGIHCKSLCRWKMKTIKLKYIQTIKNSKARIK